MDIPVALAEEQTVFQVTYSAPAPRTGGKTGEEEVEKVEEQQSVGDGGAGLLSGPG